ncbi:hypothetical protein GCE86_02840 [Micromonospora terminaliae]|uniref:Uncharacterized protein n=1 Tax=Micromonospora terminaliae TaxID=1914461 RepID=A0AAJ3DMT6_9ACTN|nr:hypothetical protein [Micromonospora terminaliae]NES31743.1 hypothetical protein [Micromonospora terminaliae]QGL46078.1 hypothetical protein GCE86_02840 [Micromonospora terminaliae]
MAPSLPAYAVPDVEPVGGAAGLPRVSYFGDQLATCAAVTAVLDRLPAVLTMIEDCGGQGPLTVTRADLCAQLSVGTSDGLNWGLSFDDEVGLLVQPNYVPPSPESDPGDPLEAALAAQPDVDLAYHYDREYFEVRMARVHRADEMLARWLDAIITAHREFARRRGIDLPY